jgi:hypothetical protein
VRSTIIELGRGNNKKNNKKKATSLSRYRRAIFHRFF